VHPCHPCNPVSGSLLHIDALLLDPSYWVQGKSQDFRRSGRGWPDQEGPQIAQISADLIRKAGTQESRKGISVIEGKAARVAATEWSRRAARDIDGKAERSNVRST
jgi:hypothetical protein